MSTAEIMRALPKTCEKCGQSAVHVESDRDGQSFAMLRTGHLVCGPCFAAYRAAELAPQGDAMRLFTPAPAQIAGQLGF